MPKEYPRKLRLNVQMQRELTSLIRDELTDPRVAAFREKVAMVLDPEVDGAYPQRWLGRVEVQTVDGRQLQGAIDEPKGDPGNTLSRPELEDKFQRLLAYSGARSPEQGSELIGKVWQLHQLEDLHAIA